MRVMRSSVVTACVLAVGVLLPSDGLSQPLQGSLAFENHTTSGHLSAILQWGVIRITGTNESTGSYRLSRDFSGVSAADRAKMTSDPRFTLVQGERGTEIGVKPGQVEGFHAFILEVTVPKDLRFLRVEMVRGGQIFVDHFDGDLTVVSHNGSIRLTDIRGPLSAEALNGEITAEVTRTHMDWPITLMSRNGSLELSLAAQTGGQLDIETRSGPIAANVPIEIEALPGRIRSEEYRPRRARATLPRPGPRIKLLTLNGSVTVAVGR